MRSISFATGYFPRLGKKITDGFSSGMTLIGFAPPCIRQYSRRSRSMRFMGATMIPLPNQSHLLLAKSILKKAASLMSRVIILLNHRSQSKLRRVSSKIQESPSKIHRNPSKILHMSKMKKPPVSRMRMNNRFLPTSRRLNKSLTQV